MCLYKQYKKQENYNEIINNEKDKADTLYKNLEMQNKAKKQIETHNKHENEKLKNKADYDKIDYKNKDINTIKGRIEEEKNALNKYPWIESEKREKNINYLNEELKDKKDFNNKYPVFSDEDKNKKSAIDSESSNKSDYKRKNEKLEKDFT